MQGIGTGPRRTFARIVARRKAEDERRDAGRAVPLGIHARRLPRFSDRDCTMAYWKFQDGKDYSLQPVPPLPHENRSQVVLPVPAPLAVKVNQVSFTDLVSANQGIKIAKKPKRWSSVLRQARGPAKSVYDDDYSNNLTHQLHDRAPLFSSFTPSGVFVDPLQDTAPASM